jgi:hypothetical protein
LIDSTPSRLYRVGEEGRCIEAGSPEDAAGYVSTSNTFADKQELIILLYSSQYGNEAYDYPNNIKEVRLGFWYLSESS